MSKALIVVDPEKEWITEDSDYYVGDISDVIARVDGLLAYCREHGYKIIFIRHIEKDTTPDEAFAEGSERVEFISDIDFHDDDTLIEKYHISPFYETGLEDELDGIDEIICCGILINLCVRSLIHDAYDRGFDIKVIKDCCVAFDDETLDFTIKDLQKTRAEIEFMDLADFTGE